MSLLYDPEQDAEMSQRGMEEIQDIPSPGFYELHHTVINSIVTIFVVILILWVIRFLCRRYNVKVIYLHTPLKRIGFTLSLLGIFMSIIGMISSNEVSGSLFVNSLTFSKWFAPESNILGIGFYILLAGIYIVYLHDITGELLLRWIVKGTVK
ncbi:hypothetical protein [Tatumella saanichensis]|uniref:hypothetical protein n=1 Tax=Tatumella saanichensis TaxID=480813 RepID=UPI0004A39F9B|nr:hypothetical protein [Tatumella saanichensis]